MSRLAGNILVAAVLLALASFLWGQVSWITGPLPAWLPSDFGLTCQVVSLLDVGHLIGLVGFVVGAGQWILAGYRQHAGLKTAGIGIAIYLTSTALSAPWAATCGTP